MPVARQLVVGSFYSGCLLNSLPRLNPDFTPSGFPLYVYPLLHQPANLFAIKPNQNTRIIGKLNKKITLVAYDPIGLLVIS
jgi:hypothetical protein